MEEKELSADDLKCYKELVEIERDREITSNRMTNFIDPDLEKCNYCGEEVEEGEPFCCEGCEIKYQKERKIAKKEYKKITEENNRKSALMFQNMINEITPEEIERFKNHLKNYGDTREDYWVLFNKKEKTNYEKGLLFMWAVGYIQVNAVNGFESLKNLAKKCSVILDEGGFDCLIWHNSLLIRRQGKDMIDMRLSVIFHKHGGFIEEATNFIFNNLVERR